MADRLKKKKDRLIDSAYEIVQAIDDAREKEVAKA